MTRQPALPPLDRSSPVPLYHQIAEALRWRISTGQLVADDRLPPVRALAAQLGVNLHTVRQAYAVLADEGLIERRGARGTVVLGTVTTSAPSAGGSFESFLSDFIDAAEHRFQLTPNEICEHLQRRLTVSLPTAVTVVECSESQCRDHCAELAARWQVEARPFSLEQPGEPDPGPIVATYFHYAEIRGRWPHRLADLRFVPIHVDPSLPNRLAPALVGHDIVYACEMDPSKTHNLRVELALRLPQLAIEPLTVERAADALDTAPVDRPVLFAPRVWGRLSDHERRNPRAHQARFTIEPTALEHLGRQHHWSPREPLPAPSQRRSP